MHKPVFILVAKPRIIVPLISYITERVYYIKQQFSKAVLGFEPMDTQPCHKSQIKKIPPGSLYFFYLDLFAPSLG